MPAEGSHTLTPSQGPWVAVIDAEPGETVAPNWEIRAASGATIAVFYGEPDQDYENAQHDAELAAKAVNDWMARWFWGAPNSGAS